jgi:hypothetical protein
VRRAACRVAAVAVAATLVGCATPAGLERHLASASVPLRDCALWYRALDAETDAAGVRDAQQASVSGFPYLRIDRLHAALRPLAAKGEPALGAWAARLAALDLEARRLEIENMPGESLDALPDARGSARARALERTRECAGRLREADLADPLARERMLEDARVPDDYSDAMRILGLYAFTRLPFAAGVRDWQDQTLAEFRRGPAPPEGAALVRYAPPGSEEPDYAATARILARSAADPLGIPGVTESEFEQLSSAYAPSLEIEVSGDYDRFGALRWASGASPPEVDAAEPVVYRQAAYTRYNGRTLLQLVYTIWFPERPAQGRFDILAGKLDGVVWRVTLAPDGEPLVYDAIHPCGCYHMFFPTARARPTAAPDSLDEWAFVPQTLPRVRAGERPLVRIAARTHAIASVSLVRGRDSLPRYAFRPYDELRSLARPEGGARSAFGPDGLIAGSERSERFLFWPMGIASAGAMRQWGRHATAFVGRRHFDDADLLERRFEFSLDGAAR